MGVKILPIQYILLAHVSSEEKTMTTTPTTDVAIIGGGAMGASTAYYLAKAGIRSTIIEREGIATKASGYNAGGLNPLTGYGLPGPLTDISNVTFRYARRTRPVP